MLQCPECLTTIRVGQIHSVHGWTEFEGIMVEGTEVIDDDEGRPMFAISPSCVVPSNRRGRLCTPDDVLASEYLSDGDGEAG